MTTDCWGLADSARFVPGMHALGSGVDLQHASTAPIWARCFTAFRVNPSDTVAMRQVFAMRYDVYCLDRKFLRAEDYAEGIECDQYDQRAEHVLAVDTQDRPAGSIRLIRSFVPGDLPFEEHCHVSATDGGVVDRRQSAEISRMVVDPAFRNRRFVAAIDPGGAMPMPLLLLALYRQLYHISCDLDIRWWYAAMELAHARAFSGLGFTCTAIGPVADYYGPVAPYIIDLRMVERSLAATQSVLLDWFQRRSA